MRAEGPEASCSSRRLRFVSGVSRSDGVATNRVALITSNFWPEPIGIGQVAWELACYFADARLDVTVVTSMPYYPKWAIWPEYTGRIWTGEVQRRVRILRSWHYVRANPSTIGRLLHETTLALVSIPNMIRALRGARVAYIISPALTYAFVASVVSALLRVRRVLYVQDVQPDAAIELGMFQSRPLIVVSRWLADTAYRLSDEILTIGAGMRARIATRAGGATKIRVVPNTVDPRELRPVPAQENTFRQRFMRSGSFSVVHTGNMGHKQDLDIILQTANRLRSDPDTEFFVFGDGARKGAFLSEMRALGLPNVAHHPLQARELLPHMLSGADVCLVTQVREVVDIAVPSKLATALCAGAFVVVACTKESETARVVRENDVGLWVPAGDDQALAKVIQLVKQGHVDSKAYRIRAREFAIQAYGREHVYGALVNELDGAPVNS